MNKKGLSKYPLLEEEFPCRHYCIENFFCWVSFAKYTLYNYNNKNQTVYVLCVYDYYLIICCNCRLYSYTFQTLAHKFILITILNSQKMIDICCDLPPPDRIIQNSQEYCSPWPYFTHRMVK